jgi:large subunit ribosomal protein L20
MPRTHSRVAAHARHKKILRLAAGHSGKRHRNYRVANESVMHALRYAWEHRRDKKGNFRRLWITRINAAARLNGTTYARLIDGLTKAGVTLDRKILADLAVREPDAFSRIAERAKAALVAA